jgi:hypothetical protein
MVELLNFAMLVTAAEWAEFSRMARMEGLESAPKLSVWRSWGNQLKNSGSQKAYGAFSERMDESRGIKLFLDERRQTLAIWRDPPAASVLRLPDEGGWLR